MQTFGQAMNDQHNRMFINGAFRPNRFPSDAYPNWVQWILHFIAVVEANRCTEIQANNAFVCLSGHALDEFHAASSELKQLVNGGADSTLRALFEHLDRALRVLLKDRNGIREFEVLAQTDSESLRDFARIVWNTSIIVYANVVAGQRDERFQECFLGCLSNAELLDVLFREVNSTFSWMCGWIGDYSRLHTQQTQQARIRTQYDSRSGYSEEQPGNGHDKTATETNVSCRDQRWRPTLFMRWSPDLTDVQRPKELRRCYECGKGHFAEICWQRRNLLN